MPRQYTWESLPQVIKDMDPDEREEYLAEKGILLVPSGVSPPPNAIIESAKKEQNIDTSSTDVMGFGPGITHPENRANMMKAAVGGGSTALGGGGPIAAGVMGALNAATGPDPFSGRGVAEAVGNAAFGRLAPFMNAGVFGKGGQFVQGIKNGLLGAGQVGATQALGDKLTQNPMPANESLGPMGMFTAGATSALLPAAAGRFLKSVEKSTPMVRSKMQPIVEKLTRKPQAVETLPAAPDIPTAPPTFDEKIKKLVQYVEDNDPERYGKTDIVSAQSGQNKLMAQMRASLLARGMPEEEIERKLAAAGGGTAPVRTPPPAAPTSTAGAPPTPAAPLDIYQSIDERIGDLTTERMDKYRKGMQGQNIRENTDAMAVIGEMRRGGSRKFIDDIVASKDWSDVPRKLEYLDMAFPDGEHRTAIKDKITESVMSAVGKDNDPFGDLSLVQRLQSFGKQKFGNKTGTEVINKIFGSEHAYQNLSDMQEIIATSGKSAPGDTTRARIFWNNAKPVIATTVGSGAMGGAIGGFTAYIPILGAAGAGAAGYATVKAITIGMDTAVDWLSRRGTKWADVLYDLSTGGNRYSRQTISNVIGGLRRAAEEERDLSAEEAAAEYQQRMQQ